MRFKNWLLNEGAEIKIDLPSVRQSKNFDCGAAALRSIAEFFKAGPDKEQEYIKLVNATHEKGSTPIAVMAGAKKIGLQAEMHKKMTIRQLISFLEQKKPVICAIQAWGDKKTYPDRKSGHYVIAIGYDNQKIYFEDPSLQGKRGFLSHHDFNKRWHDEEDNGDVYDHAGLVIWKDTANNDEEHLPKAGKIK